MAGRERDPEILKSEAQELLKRAKRIEERRFKQVGQLVYEHYKKDFSDFDTEQFKSDVREAFEGKKKANV
jgi:hypothetical protein